MGLNDVVSSERIHIGIFGLRNAGKSSVVNCITNQNLSVVSPIKGTTTDPVKKAMELLPLGPVVITDTPGIDDEGELGKLRVEKAKDTLSHSDVAVLIVDVTCGLTTIDQQLISLFKERQIPYIIAYNKSDLMIDSPISKENEIYISAKDNQNINELKEMIAKFAKKSKNQKELIADLLSPGDIVVLVMPIDSSAPKGRLILPQQQTIRAILDIGGIVVSCQDSELKQTLASLSKQPKLVITDSQAFQKVAKDVPENILLTSFSILFARYKGDIEEVVKGATQLDYLQDGDIVLISEGCTHHRQCEDIGTVKLPRWIQEYTGKDIQFVFTSGTEFPKELPYSLIIHCGGCMLNQKEMNYRIQYANQKQVPITNYGLAIAHMNGILYRSLKPFPNLLELFD
jgi:hydrogenase maturation GTPase HydF